MEPTTRPYKKTSLMAIWRRICGWSLSVFAMDFLEILVGELAEETNGVVGHVTFHL
jgi:hypothetical protein